MAELADLDPLRGLEKLTHLVLMENPVTRKEVGQFLFISPFLFYFTDCVVLDSDFAELSLLGYLANAHCSLP